MPSILSLRVIIGRAIRSRNSHVLNTKYVPKEGKYGYPAIIRKSGKITDGRFREGFGGQCFTEEEFDFIKPFVDLFVIYIDPNNNHTVMVGNRVKRRLVDFRRDIRGEIPSKDSKTWQALRNMMADYNKAQQSGDVAWLDVNVIT